MRPWVPLALLATLSCRQSPPPPTPGAGAGADTSPGSVATDSLARSAAQFTQAFYDWYHQNDDRFERAVAERPALFEAQLLQAMRADLAASARNPNEVVGLDWDPFTASQDPCDPYKVDRTTRRGDTVLVAVKGTCTNAAPRPGPDVIAEVMRVGATWVFVDFRHAADPGSLLGDLANLRSGRDSAASR